MHAQAQSSLFQIQTLILTPFSSGVVTTIDDSIWVLKLSEFYQKQAVVVGEATSLVKKYIGRDTTYGGGGVLTLGA